MRVNAIRYWNENINPFYGKWVELGIKIRFNKRNLRYVQIVEEFEIVKAEMDRLNKQIEDEVLNAE